MNRYVRFLSRLTDERRITVVQLVYRNKPYEGSSKDYEFSRQAMLEHWQAGLADVTRCMCHREKMKRRPATPTMLIEHDLEVDIYAEMKGAK